jgi:hypothetical protein
MEYFSLLGVFHIRHEAIFYFDLTKHNNCANTWIHVNMKTIDSYSERTAIDYL